MSRPSLRVFTLAALVSTGVSASAQERQIQTRRAIELNPNLGGPDDPLSVIHVLRVARLDHFAITSDGKRIAMDVSQLGHQDMWIGEIGVEKLEQMAAPDGTRQSDPDWSPDGTRLVFVDDRAGSPNLYVTEDGGTTVQALTSHQGTDRNPRFSPDGTHIAYASRRIAGDTGWDLWIVPSKGGTPKRLSEDPYDEADPQWTPDSRSLVYVQREGRHVDRELARVALDGRHEPLSPKDWGADAFAPRVSPDGSRVAFVTNKTGRKQIFALPMEGGEPEPLVTSEFELTDPAWSPDGGALAYVENRDGDLRLKLQTLGSPRARTLTLGAGTHYAPRFQRDGESLFAFAEAPNYPRDVWRFDIEGGRTRISDTLPGEIDVRQFVRPELIRYKGFDETEITGYLYLPSKASAEEPVPLLVRPHGGPTSQWTNGWHGFTQFLAQQGYAVFAPNARGSTGFGQKFEDLNDGAWGRGDLDDLIAGTRFVQRRADIRNDRVAIWGVSYGGFLTLNAIGKYPDMFTCAIEAVGMPDLVALYRQTNTEGKSYLDRELGPLSGNLELYRTLSPLQNLEAIETPLLSFHGETYPLVPNETKREFFQALHARTDYRLLEFVFKGEMARSTYRHDLYPAAANAYLEKILEYLRIYL